MDELVRVRHRSSLTTGGDVVTIDVRHPSGRGLRGVDFPKPVSDETLERGVGHLNHAIRNWPVRQITIEEARVWTS